MKTLLSKNPLAFVIGGKIIEGRFDVNYYKPEYREIIEELKNSPFEIRKLGDIIFLSTERWEKLGSGTFRYIEINDIDTFSGQVIQAKELNVEDAPSRAQMIVRKDDIIVSTTRPYRGAIALVTEEYNGCICSTGFAVIRDLKTKVNRKYLLHILHSNLGLKQMEQRMTGGNYPAITPQELIKIWIPILPTEMQDKIAQTMNQALKEKKEMEKEAAELLNSIDDYMLSELGMTLPEFTQNASLKYAIGAKFLKNNRWDVAYWRPDFRSTLEVMQSLDFEKKYLKDVANINPMRKVNGLKDCDLVPYVGLPETDEKALEIKEVKLRPHKEVKGRNIIKTGDILFGRIEPSIYNKKYIFVEDLKGYDYAFTSTEFHVIEPQKAKIDPIYLYWYIRSKAGYNQIFGKMTGTTGRRRLEKRELESFNIITPPENIQKRIAQELKSRLVRAKQLRGQANQLLENVKQKIERIILGEEMV